MGNEREVNLDELSRVRALLKKYDVRREGVTYVEEVSFIKPIKKSKDKNGKDDRLLVVSKSFIWVFKNDGKEVALKKHLLDMKELVTDEPEEFKITFVDKTVLAGSSQYTDELISRLLFGVRFILPGLKPTEYPFKTTIVPPDRIQSLDKLLEGTGTPEACGGYVQTYMSYTRRYDLDFIDSFIWEINNKYPVYHIRALDIDDTSEALTYNKDLQPMIESLKHNQYFRSLSAKEYHIGSEGVGYIAEAMRGNTKIEKLSLINVGANKGDFIALFEAMASNVMCAVSSLDVSHNDIEDKAALALANYIQHTMHGFSYIDLSYTDIKKNMVKVLEALLSNAPTLTSLTYLNLSHVDVGNSAGSVALQKLLAACVNLKKLDISYTGVALDVVAEGLKGCVNSLTSLDISGNVIPGKSSKSQGAPMLEKFLASCTKMVELNLADTKSNATVLLPTFSALSRNIGLANVSLNLSKNSLGSSITQLAAVFSASTYIRELSLDDCELGDEGLLKLVQCILKMTQLKKLSLDNNFKTKSKARNKALAALVCLLDQEHSVRRACQLEHFSIANTSGKGLDQFELATFVERALIDNEMLQSFNISGHHTGDLVALSLSKNLPMCRKLKRLVLDNNDTTLQGLSVLEMGIRRSYTLTEFPLPVNDIVEINKSTPAVYGCTGLSVGMLWSRIDKYLKRNANPTAVKAVIETVSNFTALTHSEQQNLNQLVRTAEDALRAKAKTPEEIAKKVPNATVIRGVFDTLVKESQKQVMAMDAACEQKLQQLNQEISDELAGVYDLAVQQSLALVSTYDPATLGVMLEMTKRPLDFDSCKSDLVVESGHTLHLLNDRAILSLTDAACDITYTRIIGHLEACKETAKPLPIAPARGRSLSKVTRRTKRPDSMFATTPDDAFVMEDMETVLEGINEE